MTVKQLKYEQERRLKTAKFALGFLAGEYILSQLLFGLIFTLFTGGFIYAFAIYALVVNQKLYKKSQLFEGSDEDLLKTPKRAMILSAIAIGLQFLMTIGAIWLIFRMIGTYQTYYSN